MDERHLREAAAPLIALARIWQQGGSASSESSNSPALLLLEQLLALCSAQRGALLLPRGPSVAHVVALLPATAPLAAFGILAKLEMSEEEVLPLLAAFAPTGAPVQTSPQQPGWLLCRLPLATVPISRAAEPAGPAPREHFSSAPLPVDALLVLGWKAKEPDPCLNALEKGCGILPLVADVAGVLLTNLLLCERLAACKTEMQRHAMRELEVLPADLLANVSHELRSPLTSIKGCAETLLRLDRRTSRQQRHEFLLSIKQAGDDLAGVIDRLLEMTQLDTGSLRIERFPVNLAHLVREALSTAEQRIAVKEQQPTTPLTFTLRLEDLDGRPTNTQLLIQADRRRLREVLDSLLENAIAYSPRGGTIEVTVRPMSLHGLAERLQRSRPAANNGAARALPPSLAQQSHQGVELCVRDQGVGIPPEQLERIFERFHRLDIRLTRPVNGLGLGLAICKRIVELHDGMIWAESEVGAGSVFHVWLPAAMEI